VGNRYVLSAEQNVEIDREKRGRSGPGRWSFQMEGAADGKVLFICEAADARNTVPMWCTCGGSAGYSFRPYNNNFSRTKSRQRHQSRKTVHILREYQ